MDNSNVKERKSNKRNRKNNLIKFILIIIVLIIISIIIALVLNRNKDKEQINNNNETNTLEEESYIEEIEDGVKINKSSKLNEVKEINGLLITNIQLTTKDGMTTLLADVQNNSGVKTDVKTLQITLLNKDGSELTTVTGIVNGLEIGETTQLNIAMTSDYVNAYDFRVSENK